MRYRQRPVPPKHSGRTKDTGETREAGDDDALDAIAESALERKLGARGLRTIIEELMLDIMYTLPGQKEVRECVVTREVVQSKDVPITVIEKAG